MLQRQQLETLTICQSAAVSELRDFMTGAGVPVETSASLHTLAERLRQDRSFHRDLTSHLWVLMEESAQQSGTLLGLLAVAAAGPKLATEATAEDAHALLRFVMEARRAFGITHDAEIVPVPVNAGTRLAAALTLELPITPSKVRTSVRGKSRLQRVLWPAAACLFLVAAGLWFWVRPSTTKIASAPIVNAPAALSATGAAPVPSYSVTPDAPAASHLQPRWPSAPLPRTPSGTPALAPASGNTPASVPVEQAPKPILPASSSQPVAQHPVLSAGLGSKSPGSAVPVPSATLSKRLGSPTMPGYASTEDESETRRHPRLLRRPPQQDNLRDSGDDPLLAEADTGNIPSSLATNRVNGIRPASGVGVVRPASLGAMGANALYTPVPPYPVEASAANVQGEVRIQARIDSGGNVASARVISGPPLLRDAALNAVQHWRYRPYMASGKASATNAIAVVDFELQ